VIGRPTKYSEEITDRICEVISNSSKGIHAVCQEEGMPSPSTVFKWLSENKTFSDKYARAKEAQADFMGEEMINLADTYRKTEIEYHSDQGSSTTTQDNVQRSKLQIEARKWLMAKLHPKKYGDKMDVTTDGEKITSFNVGFKKQEEE